MNDWTPPAQPHKNEPNFPFDRTKRNPVKDGKPRLGKKRPELRNTKPTTAKEQFEAMCARLLKLIDRFNAATMKCKAARTTPQMTSARKSYDAAVADLNRFMGRTPGVSNPGYQRFLKSGSFKIEVVVSYGFVVAARLFGTPLMMMQESSLTQEGSSEGPFDRPRGPIDGPTSSSCYSIYPPPG
jgi:hypothetical protein